MKKSLYIFLILTVLIAGIWMLNQSDVISIKAWSEKVITSTPLEKYVKTNQEYNVILKEKQKIEARNEELENINSDLKYSLDTSSKQIDSQRNKIEMMKEKISRLNEERDNREQRVNKLVKIYSQMDPEKAAEILPALDRDLSLTLLIKLEDEQAAEILSELPSEEAVVLTEGINE